MSGALRRRTLLVSLALVIVGVLADLFVFDQSLAQAMYTGITAGLLYGVSVFWIETRRRRNSGVPADGSREPESAD